MPSIEGNIDFHGSRERDDEDLRDGLREDLTEGGTYSVRIAALDRETFKRFDTYVLNDNSISPLLATTEYLSPKEIEKSGELLTQFEAVDPKNTNELKRIGAQMEAILLPYR